jgi:hypothetical protein
MVTRTGLFVTVRTCARVLCETRHRAPVCDAHTLRVTLLRSARRFSAFAFPRVPTPLHGLIEQQSPQGDLVCDHAGLINRFSPRSDGRRSSSEEKRTIRRDAGLDGSVAAPDATLDDPRRNTGSSLGEKVNPVTWKAFGMFAGRNPVSSSVQRPCSSSTGESAARSDGV